VTVIKNDKAREAERLAVSPATALARCEARVGHLVVRLDTAAGDLARITAERDTAIDEAREAREEASRAWAVLTGRDWMETRHTGSAVVEATRVAAERDEAIAELERLRAAAEALVPRGIPTTLMNDRDRGLAHALDATPTDLAASQRREWRASGMEAAADLVEQRLAERCAELRAACSAYMRPDGSIRRCTGCPSDTDADDMVRDMAKRERGA
jgi:hypothetical protein